MFKFKLDFYKSNDLRVLFFIERGLILGILLVGILSFLQFYRGLGKQFNLIDGVVGYEKKDYVFFYCRRIIWDIDNLFVIFDIDF